MDAVPDLPASASIVIRRVVTLTTLDLQKGQVRGRRTFIRKVALTHWEQNVWPGSLVRGRVCEVEGGRHTTRKHLRGASIIADRALCSKYPRNLLPSDIRVASAFASFAPLAGYLLAMSMENSSVKIYTYTAALRVSELPEYCISLCNNGAAAGADLVVITRRGDGRCHGGCRGRV